MVKDVRLVKLRLEIPINTISKMRVRLLYRTLRVTLIKNVNSFKRLSHRPYPIDYSQLVKMCRLTKSGFCYYLGIWPDSLNEKEKQAYLKVLDVEYGVNGIEQRIMRRSLEECFIKLG